MKNLLAFILISASAVCIAQPAKKGKGPSMAPEFKPGYYVTTKGDTVKGEIQTNLENEGELYKTINFKDARSPKVVIITTKKAKAYGYEENHFVLNSYDPNNEVYLRYLAKGRLNLLEYKYPDVVAGVATIKSEYYIQDSKADEENKDLRELKKLNEKFYKKELKIYMKDQPMIWNDLDKFTFKPDAVSNSIREYNRFYDGN